MRCGASRKSSAERDGGVSTTIRSHVPGRRQLAELLHRHVLLRAGERRGDRLVEGVGEDLLGAVRGGVGLHHLVEGAAHVEHHRVQLARPRAVRHARPTRPRLVAQLRQPQRLGQPARRVDRQHGDPRGRGPPRAAPARRGGRLADAAGAAADHDPGRRVVEQRVDVERRRSSCARRPGCHQRRRPARRGCRGRRRRPGAAAPAAGRPPRAAGPAPRPRPRPARRARRSRPTSPSIISGARASPADGQAGADARGVHPAVRGRRHRAVRAATAGAPG